MRFQEELANQPELQKILRLLRIILLLRKINTGIIKPNISDLFPMFLIAETEKRMTPEGKLQVAKRLVNNKTKEKF